MKNETYTPARYLPFGDNALLVEFGNSIDPETNQKVISLDRIIQKTKIEGVEELVPTYRSLLIRYNPLKTDYETLVSHVKTLENTLEKTKLKTQSRNIVIPVVYGGEYGPDLEYVAERHGLTREKVIELHSERQYRVYMIGFVAGFPYLGEVTDEISTPRLETPRLRVPAGSVGIAEKQTGVYPCEAPGGWRIIGRTPLKLFNPSWQPPALLKSGDTVRFKPISANEFKVLAEGQ